MKKDLLLELGYALAEDSDISYIKKIRLNIALRDKNNELFYRNELSFIFVCILSADGNHINEFFMQPCEKFKLSLPPDFEALEKISSMFAKDSVALLEDEDAPIIDA